MTTTNTKIDSTKQASDIMSKLHALKAKKGVGYYNKDNKDKRNKEDKENNYCLASQSDNDFSPSSVGSKPQASQSNSEDQVAVALSLREGQLEEGEPLDSGAWVPETRPEIYSEMRTAIIQLFDNGEGEYQRYKCKVRINLTDGENPEFIANLTKDLRNFKKYIPAECKEEVINAAVSIRKVVKEKYGTYPYVGKFHFNNPEGSRTIEPFTFVAIWYDAENKGWSGHLVIYDWEHKFDLFTQYLKPNQIAAGVKGQDTFTHPNHQKKRPLTWAQQRALQNRRSN